MSTTPPYSTIIRSAVERLISGIAGGMPARIEAYDPVHQRADVQPLVLDGSGTGDDRVVRRLPMITDVPVLMLGTGRCRTTMDLRPGDTVWILSASRSLDRYLVQGGEVDPQDDRRHNISDAVALPAVFDFAHVPSDASTDGVIVHGARVRLGGPDAADPVVRKSDLDAVVTKLNDLRSLFIGHGHATAGSLGTPSGPVGSLPSLTPITTVQLPSVPTPACSPTVTSK